MFFCVHFPPLKPVGGRRFENPPQLSYWSGSTQDQYTTAQTLSM